MTPDTFRDLVARSVRGMYRDFFRRNRHRIKIKKERVAVGNLMRISEAALSLSNEKGFSAMSMRDLSAASGLSIGALYSYFSSKDELLDMIQQQSAQLATGVLDSSLQGIDDPRRRLERAISAHLHLSEIMRPWFLFSYMEAKNLGKAARRRAMDIELRMERLFAGIIADGQRTGIFREVDRTLTAAMIKALLQDWYLKSWKHARRKIPVEAYAAFVVEVVESYVLARSAGKRQEAT